jgi:hypothetical protein
MHGNSRRGGNLKFSSTSKILQGVQDPMSEYAAKQWNRRPKSVHIEVQSVMRAERRGTFVRHASQNPLDRIIQVKLQKRPN